MRLPLPLLPLLIKSTKAGGVVDLSGYYWQNGVADKSRNCHGIFDPHETKYKFFELGESQFGSIHSIFTACRISEALTRVFTKLLKIVVSMYIDDAKNLARRQRIKYQIAAICCVLVALGFDISYKKVMNSTEQMQLWT